jgi:hypothetical protein
MRAIGVAGASTGGTTVNHRMRSRLLVLTVALVAGGLATSTIAKGLRAHDAKPSDLARNLVGTWALAGTPDKPEDPPAKGGRLKFFTGKCWCITEAGADNKVVFHHGGTYTLVGNQMDETIDYANDNTANLIGKTHQFTIKVDGDVYTQFGINNQFNERWVRVK